MWHKLRRRGGICEHVRQFALNFFLDQWQHGVFNHASLYSFVHPLCDTHEFGPVVYQIGNLQLPRPNRIQWRYDPFWNVTIGEASNPGPGPFKIAVVNPTAVLGKIADICTLQAHVVTLSENSATKSVQVESSQTWRNHGFKTIWNTPVAAHTWAFKEDEARRGQASGVSIHSRLPIRNARIPISDSIDQTRLVSAVIQCGQWPIHVVAIY